MMNQERTSNTIVVCPIVYGSIAFYLGKKAEEFATHKWTLYIRGPRDEDLSTFVDKVIFTLHPSFAQPVREVTSPPFEVTETGWGEFEAGIRLVFRDPTEQPLDLFHQIRLYPPASQHQVSTKKPVVAESYDEVVFADPRPSFHGRLLSYGSSLGNSATSSRKPTAFPEHYLSFDEAADLEILAAIRSHIGTEIALAKQRLVNAEADGLESSQEKRAQQDANSSRDNVSITGSYCADTMECA
eukprot:gene26775-32353_t